MKTIRFLFFLPLLALAACQPSVTEQAIRQQLRDFPETRAQDIYKSFCQDNLGPGHLIPDPESARSYLRKELQTCREERENQQYVAFGRPYEPVGDQGNYVRVDLSVVLDGLVGEEALLDAFVRSANAGRTVSKEAWVSRWRDVEALLRKKFSSIPDLEADLQRIDSLLGAGNLTLHHSRAFGEAYHPHYRIVAKDIFENELRDLIDKRTVVLETTLGTIELELYGATPLHSANFRALVAEAAYDSLLFHRVIRDFMIQGGDPDSKEAAAGVLLGEGDRPYTVPAEFRLEEGIFHRRGVLAAAREGDEVNPEQRSSAMQFYIVWGRVFDEEGLDKVQERLDARTGGRVKLTPAMRQVYRTVGGTPHLDGQYTVFGEVRSGLDVVDAIQQVPTDGNDRPLTDVRILQAYLKSGDICNFIFRSE